MSDTASNRSGTRQLHSIRPSTASWSRPSREVELSLLSNDDRERFRRLTYPAYGTLLRAGPNDEVIAIGSLDAGGRPIGLALGRARQSNVQLLSIFVDRQQRGSGLAGALLSGFCDLASGKRADCVVGHVPLVIDGRPSRLVPTLAAGGWQATGDEQFVGHFDVARVSSELRRRFSRSRSSWTLQPWQFGAPAPCASPPGLHPRRFTPRAPDGRPFVRTASFGIHDADGAVKGWFLAHALSPGTLRLTSHWCEDAQQGARNVFCTWRDYLATIRRQGWRLLTFSTGSDHPRFLQFSLRHLAPHATWWGHNREMTIGLRDGD